MKKLIVVVIIAASPALAQINMPDPSQIAGRAIPAPELPDGTVSVRLVRESIGNNITGHDVTVSAAGVTRTARTDDSGRAQVVGLPAGANATAAAVVDGERLTSQPFDVPGSGGIRVILIAGLQNARARREKEEADAASAPAVKGSVVFGSDSRFVFEFQNDALSVFYLLDVVNTARTRVDTGGPLIVDLPSGAGAARVMQGSYPGATVQGDRITIAGPFPPGTSSIQVGFQLLYSGDAATVRQTFPASLQRVAVFAEKVGALEVASPQFADRGEVKAGDGTVFLSGTGGAVAAGTELTIQLTNLPHHKTWPRNVALGLAAVVVVAGVWLAFRRDSGGDERRRLVAHRESLYGELVKLEAQRGGGRVDDERYQTKRRHLLSQLERVYGELDDPLDAPKRGAGTRKRREGGGAAA
jgi:hypothetical protein